VDNGPDDLPCACSGVPAIGLRDRIHAVIYAYQSGIA
jgi:hypothetical protein